MSVLDFKNTTPPKVPNSAYIRTENGPVKEDTKLDDKPATPAPTEAK